MQFRIQFLITNENTMQVNGHLPYFFFPNNDKSTQDRKLLLPFYSIILAMDHFYQSSYYLGFGFNFLSQPSLTLLTIIL